MTGLGLHARTLLEDARRALRPSAADRERVASALRARLGPQALAPELSSAPFAAHGGLHLAPASITVVCFVGGALLLALGVPAIMPARPAPPRQSPAEAARPQEGARGESTLPAPPRSQALTPPSTSAPPTVLRRRQDTLAREVVLLSRATSLLRAGRPHEALTTLAVHERRHPGGLLIQERRAAKAQALCLARRVAEGRAEIAHLAPRSPAARRAREACDEASSTADAVPGPLSPLEVP